VIDLKRFDRLLTCFGAEHYDEILCAAFFICHAEPRKAQIGDEA